MTRKYRFQGYFWQFNVLSTGSKVNKMPPEFNEFRRKNYGKNLPFSGTHNVSVINTHSAKSGQNLILSYSNRLHHWSCHCVCVYIKMVNFQRDTGATVGNMWLMILMKKPAKKGKFMLLWLLYRPGQFLFLLGLLKITLCCNCNPIFELALHKNRICTHWIVHFIQWKLYRSKIYWYLIHSKENGFITLTGSPTTNVNNFFNKLDGLESVC